MSSFDLNNFCLKDFFLKMLRWRNISVQLLKWDALYKSYARYRSKNNYVIDTLKLTVRMSKSFKVLSSCLIAFYIIIFRFIRDLIFIYFSKIVLSVYKNWRQIKLNYFANKVKLIICKGRLEQLSAANGFLHFLYINV